MVVCKVNGFTHCVWDGQCNTTILGDLPCGDSMKLTAELHAKLEDVYTLMYAKYVAKGYKGTYDEFYENHNEVFID